MKLGVLISKILVFSLLAASLGCSDSFVLQKDVKMSVTRYSPEDDIDYQEAESEADPVQHIETFEFPLQGGMENNPVDENNLESSDKKNEVTFPLIKNPPARALVGIGTVYYMPAYGDKRSCSKESIVPMLDRNEKTLVRLCDAEIKNCAMQGSCFYISKNGTKLYAISKVIEIIDPKTKEKSYLHRFKENKLIKKCPMGMGVKNICLDPYRSIAADPKYHKIGAVVFVPKLLGQLLPNGEIHDGYFVVRDTGGKIKGEGRFDFFIGFDQYKGHLFTNLNLADASTSQFEFYRVPEILARKVRIARNYPLAPSSVHAYAEQKLIEDTNAISHETELATAKFFERKWSPQ